MLKFDEISTRISFLTMAEISLIKNLYENQSTMTDWKGRRILLDIDPHEARNFLRRKHGIDHEVRSLELKLDKFVELDLIDAFDSNKRGSESAGRASTKRSYRCNPSVYTFFQNHELKEKHRTRKKYTSE